MAQPANPATADDDVSRILELIEAPAPPPARSGALAGVIASVARSARPQPIPALRPVAEELATLLARQLGAVLDHPQWRELEATWRGLRELLRALDHSGRVDLLLFPATRETLSETLRDAIDWCERDGLPLDLAVLGPPLGIGASDRDCVADLAAQAAAASLPVVLSLEDDVFAAAPGADLAALDRPTRLLASPAFDKWHALCRRDACRWLAGCLNGFLVRDAQAAAAPVFGATGWLVARRIIERVQASGWPAPISGVEALAVGAPGVAGGGARAPQRTAGAPGCPLRHALSGRQSHDFAEAGIIALSCEGPHAGADDAAWIVAAPSLYAVQTLADAAQTRAHREDAGFDRQLLRARLLRCLRELLGRVGVAGAPTPRAVEGLLYDWLAGADPDATVVIETGTDARAWLVHIGFGASLAPGLQVDLALHID